MSRLEEKDETYFTTVRGMCRVCREIVPARVFFRDGQVWQQSLCPCCTSQPALIAADQRWYLDQLLQPLPDRAPLPGSKPSRRGCPHDCGPCTWHASPCQLPVISITNACNLRCPICFTYNRSDPLYFIPVGEMRRILDWIIESSGPVDLINLTGGEPTLHPDLLEILRACQRPEIGRVTMNSNCVRLAEDRSLCRQLAELGVYVILSFNTMDPALSLCLHGQDVTAIKRKAIENLTEAGVKMTLLHVMVRGANENVASEILPMMRTSENILSLTVQTMTYTGQGGSWFPRRRHIPVDEAARSICRDSGDALRFEDFVTRPSAHPLCYLICYLLKSGERLVPLARLAPAERIRELLSDSYLLRPTPAAEQVLRDAIDLAFAEGRTQHLAILRGLVERLYPTGERLTEFERQQVAESAIRTVYIHSHMDEDTFDCSRSMLCPDLVPTEPGRLIPACTYNLFYRMQDPRFYSPAPPSQATRVV